MILKDVLNKTIPFFQQKKILTPRLDAELLLAHALSCERIDLYLRYDKPLTEVELIACREVVRRRSLGEPVAYILGYKDFYKDRFSVNSSTLIPRPETEGMVERALSWVKSYSLENVQVIDLGCGTGCIGLSILRELPKAQLWAVDLREKALELAKENSKKMGLFERVEWVCGDAALEILSAPRAHLILSNPPYIALEEKKSMQKDILDFEPAEALFAGDRGYSLLKNWSAVSFRKLASPGMMMMEMGITQGKEMKEFFENFYFFDRVEILKDLTARDRFIVGEKNG